MRSSASASVPLELGLEVGRERSFYFAIEYQLNSHQGIERTSSGASELSHEQNGDFGQWILKITDWELEETWRGSGTESPGPKENGAMTPSRITTFGPDSVGFAVALTMMNFLNSKLSIYLIIK